MMKTIDLNKEQIPCASYGGRIYTVFDGNEDRGSVITRDISKNQLVHLYSELYSAYLKLWDDNKRLQGKLDELTNSTSEEPTSEFNMEEYINQIIDKRIKEKLSFDEDSEPYSGSYACLKYDDVELGNVCLSQYYDD